MSNKSIIGIRTNKWTVNEQRVFDAISPFWGGDIKIVFHNRPDDFQPPCGVVDINDSLIEKMQLRVVHDWGWRCGDYAYYALRQAYPDYDYYWLIEPDVFVSGDARAFFSLFRTEQADVIGLDVVQYNLDDPKHRFSTPVRFATHVGNATPMRAIFALTRFSGPAIDFAYKRRVNYSSRPVPPYNYANDELFMFSHTLTNSTFNLGQFREIAPTWFADVQFDTNPDLIVDLVEQDLNGQNKILHPVVDRQTFARALAKRMVGRTGVLKQNKTELSALSSTRLDQLADCARDELRNHLRAFEG
jgi:hypothetical protein